MNIYRTPQAEAAGPVPDRAPGLDARLAELRAAILAWAASLGLLGDLIDPLTRRVIALLDSLADLFARFAAGEFARPAPLPRAAPAREPPPAPQAPLAPEFPTALTTPRVPRRRPPPAEPTTLPTPLAAALRLRTPGVRPLPASAKNLAPGGTSRTRPKPRARAHSASAVSIFGHPGPTPPHAYFITIS